MARRVRPEMRIQQKSMSIKAYQRVFLDWAEDHDKDFDANKLLQDALDKQIQEIKPELIPQ